MKTTAKKSLSILLAVIMMFSIFTIIPITASAAGTNKNISVNTYYTDRISEYNETDIFNFSISSPSKVSITVQHDLIDSTNSYWNFKLCNTNGDELINFSCQGNKTNSTSYNTGIPQGNYYIKVTSGSYRSNIDYKFKVNCTSSSTWETEKNDTYTDGDSINMNTLYSGTIGVYEDVDFYKFYLSNPSKVSINVLHDSIDSSNNYWNFKLCNTNGDELINFSSQGNKTNSTSYNTGIPKGNYYIKVTSGSYRSNIDYSFKVNCTSSSTWETETNNSYNEADSINLNTFYSGTIGVYGDEDFYKFSISNSTKVSINVKHNSINSSNNYWNFKLCNTNGDEFINFRSQGDKTNSTSDAVNIPAGNYYIKVSSGSYRSDIDYSFSVNTAASPTSVSLNKSSITLGVGESYTLTKTVSPSNASTSYTWSSSNTSAATVNSSGKITAKAVGSAKITVKTSNGKSASCTVTVKKAPSKVSLNKTSITIGVGETYDLNSSVPSGCASYTTTYSSNKTSVATVKSAGGLVTGKAVGTATITAKTYNGKTATCKVTVKKAPTSVSLNKTSITIGVGETYDLNSSVPSGCASYTTTYSSNKTSVATVKSAGGLVTGKAVGTATITAKTYNGKTATCKVTVKKAPSSISLNKTSITLKVGQTYDLNSYLPSGCASNSTKYTSSNTSVATVKAAGGLVTAKKKGTATITATTYNGKKATCKVTVK